MELFVSKFTLAKGKPLVKYVHGEAANYCDDCAEDKEDQKNTEMVSRTYNNQKIQGGWLQMV